MGFLYKLTNANGKAYIGITSRTLDERLAEHVKQSLRPRTAISAAIRKFGLEKFSIEPLMQSTDWGTLCREEVHAISEHKTLAPNGYNLTVGGDGVIGMSDCSRLKHQKNTSLATKKAWRLGTLRNSRAKAFSDPDFKQRHALATSIGTLSAFENPQVRARVIDSHRLSCYRDSVSKSIKALWATKSYRDRMTSIRQKRSPRSDESKLRQSEKMKQLIALRKKEGTYWL